MEAFGRRCCRTSSAANWEHARCGMEGLRHQLPDCSQEGYRASGPEDRRVLVERHIRNRENIFYRNYLLRDKLLVSRVIDPSPIQKMPLGIARESWFSPCPNCVYRVPQPRRIRSILPLAA